MTELGRLWVSPEDIGEKILDLSEGEKILDLSEGEKVKALLCQLRFCRLVLKSTGQRSLFNKTKVVGDKRVALNSDELKANLEEVIRLNPGSTAFGDNEEASGRVRPRDERDRFSNRKDKTLCKATRGT